MAVTGSDTRILFGQYRLSVDHFGGDFQTTRNQIDVQPTIEGNWATALQGSSKRAGTSQSYASGALLQALRSAYDTRAEMPLAIYRTGAGLGWCDVNKASIGELPDSWQIDTAESRDIVFGFTEVYKPFAGVLYDYAYEDGSTGVTGTGAGPWYQLGALAAGESYRFLLANPHYPAPDVTAVTCLVRSASDAIGTGATTEVTFTDLTSTASYELATVAGAVTNAYWQLQIFAFTGNNVYPVCLAQRID